MKDALNLDVWVGLLDLSALLAHEQEVSSHRALGSVGVHDLHDLAFREVFLGWHAGGHVMTSWWF